MTHEIFKEGIILNAVESSNIAELGYKATGSVPVPCEEGVKDLEIGIVEVIFKNGGRYRYNKVPVSIWEELRDAKSKGAVFAAKIVKGKFECHKFAG